MFFVFFIYILVLEAPFFSLATNSPPLFCNQMPNPLFYLLDSSATSPSNPTPTTLTQISTSPLLCFKSLQTTVWPESNRYIMPATYVILHFLKTIFIKEKTGKIILNNISYLAKYIQDIVSSNK